jgi:protein involved in polysaccharide export with SLBB domain
MDIKNKDEKKTRLEIVLFLFGVLLLGASSNLYAEAGKEVDASYILQTGDRIDIKIYPEDEFLKGGEAEVSSQGYVTIPLVGKIKAANQSVLDVENKIAEVLAEDYIANPQVVIEVLQYQASTFAVLGQVSRPGSYELPVGGRKMTLLEAISTAGGFNDIANTKKIKIMRKSTGAVLRINVESIISGNEQDIEILHDDVIHVSESLF